MLVPKTSASTISPLPRKNVGEGRIRTYKVFNLPRRAVPLLHKLLVYKIQHISCLSSCGLLNHTLRFRSSLYRLYCYIAFSCQIKLCNYPLAFGTRYFGCLEYGRQSISHSPSASGLSFRTLKHNLLLTTILLMVPLGIAWAYIDEPISWREYVGFLAFIPITGNCSIDAIPPIFIVLYFYVSNYN